MYTMHTHVTDTDIYINLLESNYSWSLKYIFLSATQNLQLADKSFQEMTNAAEIVEKRLREMTTQLGEKDEYIRQLNEELQKAHEEG